MNFIHEPRRTTPDVRRLRTYLAEDAEFASIVFDLREVMDTHCATVGQMRAALRLVLHDSDWRVYRRTILGLPAYDEETKLADLLTEDDAEDDAEDDGCAPSGS